MGGRRLQSVGSVIAGLTAVIYIALACLAATCSLVLPAAPRAEGHGSPHHHEAAHSSLCVWACQATSDAGLIASAPAEAVERVMSVALGVPALPVPLVAGSLLRTRAPPVLPLG